MKNTSKKFSLWQGLSAQLFLLVILPFAVLALAATLMSIGLHQNAMRSMIAERDSRSVITASNFLDSKIDAELETTKTVAMLVSKALQAPQETLEDFNKAYGPNGKNLAFINSDKQLVAFTGVVDIRQEFEISNFDPADRSVLTIDGTYYFPLSEEVVSGGWIVNLVAVQDIANTVLEGVDVDMAMTTAYLLDENKNVLATLGVMDPKEKLKDHDGVAEALKGETGYTYVKLNNIEHVVAYSPVRSTGWALVIEEPWDNVDTPYLRLTQLAPLILLPLLVFTLVALWFSLSQLVTPLQKLEKQAAELAWGDFSAIEAPVGGAREIRQLQNELILMARKVRDAQNSMRGYIGAISRGQEEERQRLARELHDETLQSLIAIQQRIQLNQMKVKEKEMNVALDELAALTGNSITELRRLTRALRPIYLEDFGLVTALEMLVKETDPLPATFTLKGKERRLEPSLELSLFRIAQEGLSNIIRHSQATHAEILIEFTASKVLLEISDNGKGFEPPRSPAEFAPAGHYGLLGIYERTELIGGKLEIFSNVGNGSRLKVLISV